MPIANSGAKFVGKEIETVLLKIWILNFCSEIRRRLCIGYIGKKKSL